MKVKVIKAGLKSYWYADKIGETFKVRGHDGGELVYDFQDIRTGHFFDKNDVEIINEGKVMKSTDKITLEFTGKQLAKIYALSGKSNGPDECCVFATLKQMFDPRQEKYAEMLSVIQRADILNYSDYGRQWEEFLFRAEQTPEQKQLAEVMTKISELQKQAEKLQGLINK